jgi:glyceraldehyde 3-phosphate dehydrogenase
MAVRIGVNGFGRIGRLVARMVGSGYTDLELAGINARADSAQLAHLLKYDSVHRRFEGQVEHEPDALIINDKKVAITRSASPSEIPWKDLGAEIVLELTGKFRKKADAIGHIEAGAKKVIIGAPGKEIDGTFVMGVNHADYDTAKHQVISNASCTTNCLAPVAKALNDAFGIDNGIMTTIHSYTMSQRILDGSSKDIRRARAAAMSMIPTTTGAAKAVTQVIPELKGKLDGFAIRVPTPDASIVDLTCYLEKAVSGSDEVNNALRAAADGPMLGIMQVTDEPLVSVDYMGTPSSSVVDAPLTQVMGDRLIKVLAWYDNEMGFTARLLDLTSHVAKRL